MWKIFFRSYRTTPEDIAGEVFQTVGSNNQEYLDELEQELISIVDHSETRLPDEKCTSFKSSYTMDIPKNPEKQLYRWCNTREIKDSRVKSQNTVHVDLVVKNCIKHRLFIYTYIQQEYGLRGNSEDETFYAESTTTKKGKPTS